tara:strand:+ start:316 stop:495 length:180 start_codon:yes stop_codon:yes gene_type:complete
MAKLTQLGESSEAEQQLARICESSKRSASHAFGPRARARARPPSLATSPRMPSSARRIE